MTRKRKAVDESAESAEPLAGYGYVKHEPHDVKMEAEPYEEEANEIRSFPTELAGYLQHIAASIEQDGPDELILTKCLEECDGEESILLGFRESSRLVEVVFTKSAFAASEFLKKLNRLKRKQRLELIYNGCSSRTIENLLFALAPLSEEVLESVVTGWKDLITDEWNDLVLDLNGALFIRSFVRMLLGLPPRSESARATKVPKPTFESSSLEKRLRRDFEQLNNLALDYGSMKGNNAPYARGSNSRNLDYMSTLNISLLMQDFAEMDAVMKCGQCSQFVMKSMENADEIEQAWKGKESSRVWEKLVLGIDEDLRQTLFASVISGQLLPLAMDKYANFPLQRLIAASNSEDSVTDILEELLGQFSDLLENQRSGVVAAVLQCVASHEDKQESVVKELRRYFNADKKHNKLHFAPNVLCMNNANSDETDSGISFDVHNSTVQGSLLLQRLLDLHRHKSVLASMMSIADDCLMKMAKHPAASRVLDALLCSKRISAENKMLFAQKLNWLALIGDKYGSRVFETYWAQPALPMESREEILLTMARSNNEDKTPVYRLMWNKLDGKGFMQNRKAWRNNFGRQPTVTAPSVPRPPSIPTPVVPVVKPEEDDTPRPEDDTLGPEDETPKPPAVEKRPGKKRGGKKRNGGRPKRITNQPL